MYKVVILATEKAVGRNTQRQCSCMLLVLKLL